MRNVFTACAQAVGSYSKAVVLLVEQTRTNLVASTQTPFALRGGVDMHTNCTQFLRSCWLVFAQVIQVVFRRFISVIFNFYPLSTHPIITTAIYI
jgi:hypothetical protein